MKFDPKKTACLTLDLQRGILSMVPGTEICLSAAKKAVDFARAQGMRLIHVGLGFQPGYPELPAQPGRWEKLRENGLFLIGTPSAEFHESVYRPGDQVIYKQRVSAFRQNTLELVLRSQGVDTLVLFGIATSGIVLSTVRAAADLDFNCVVIADACFDADPEVHRVLTEKVFARQGSVLSADEFVKP